MRRFRARPMFPLRHNLPTFLIPFFVTIVISALVFRNISSKLLPMVQTVAESKVKNIISQATAAAIDEALLTGDMDYEDFIAAESDLSGQVTSLSFQIAESASFKRQVTERLIYDLEHISSDELAIPLGTLSGVLFFSAIGPPIRVKVQSVGDISAEYRNEFSSAGVNQTRHTVYLDLITTVHLLIPGEIISVVANEQVCVAETIIVGEVPDTYLNLQNERQ